MKRVLITGIDGFIGSHLAISYINDGWFVDGIGTQQIPLVRGIDRYLRVRLPNTSIEDFLRHRPPDLCIHCAGRTAIEVTNREPKPDFDDSVVVTFSLCESIRRFAPSSRLIFMSSAAIYGNPKRLPVHENQLAAPLSGYGYHKLICETILLEYANIHNIKCNSVRIFSAYGPGLRRQVVWDTCFKLAAGSSLMMRGTGSESRDFIHIRDVVSGVRLIESKGDGLGSAYNLASGKEVRIDELVSKLLILLKAEKKVEFDGCRLGGVPLNWQADIKRLSSLGFEPHFSLEAGLEDFLHWFRTENSK